MTLRKLLLLPLLLSLALFIRYSHEVHHSLTILLDTIHLTPGFVGVLAVAVLLQVAGHIIRAYKARLIFGVAKESSTRFQFRALSIGYLFNTILPFRLGELIRARVISGAMTISFGYALALVVFERLVDALLLGLFGVLILLFGPTHTPHVISYVILLGIVAIAGLGLYWSVARQNKYILRAWYVFSRLLNDRLKTGARFKVWTIIYGLQQTFRAGLLARYVALSAASWLLYLGSLWVLVGYLLKHLSLSAHFVVAAAPYYGISLPAGPASLGVFSKVTNNFTASLRLPHNTALTYNLVAWAVLLVPIATIGLVLLFTKTRETLWYARPKTVSAGSLLHKLYRAEDISSEMEVFLEHYFSGNSLSRIVHDLEVAGEFKLVKYFKGGSDAITILVLQNGEQIVKKIIPLEFEDRLKAQYNWLKEHASKQGIVKVLGEKRAANYYAIDLEYDSDNEMFYEYIHRSTIVQSQKILDDVWTILAKDVHAKLQKEKTYPEKRELYIQKHITDCLEKAAAADPEIIRVVEPEKLIINGVEYDNLNQIMDKIRAHKQAWHDIATYRHSGAVHGDVIADNLLVSKTSGEVLVIDPAPDGNIFEGPVFDFGKLMQSLYCGYETLLRDEDAVYLADDNKIDYRDYKSNKYTKLATYIRKELAPKHLTKSEQNAILFHAGALYIRRLKHQVYYTPANVLKLYAVGVKTLNEFYAQYKGANK